jgi:hypothetical protein
MDSETGKLLTDFVMMVGLLRREMKHNNEFERYEGRFSRIERKFASLAEQISQHDPELTKALRTAFEQPARAVAFKNAEHQKELKARKKTDEPEDDDPTS